MRHLLVVGAAPPPALPLAAPLAQAALPIGGHQRSRAGICTVGFS